MFSSGFSGVVFPGVVFRGIPFRGAAFPGVALALVAGLLAGCASLSKEACRAGDWRGIGYSDGADGRSEDYVSAHRKACAKVGVTPDYEAWRAGRQAGLATYCTPQRAYSAGLRGDQLNPVCFGFDQRALARANFAGLREYEISRDIEEVEDQIREANWRIDELRDGDTSKADRSEIRRLRRDIERWRGELYRLDSERRFAPLWY